MTHILAIDQGTTSSRAIIFDAQMQIAASAQQEFAQHFPANGWVEHDPSDIWSSVLSTSRSAIEKAGLTGKDIAAIGITNQRETTLIWDRATGEPIHNAIVWQDRRTAYHCQRLKAAGHEAEVTARTGLLLDPYFSATKVSWLLDNVEGARTQALAGKLAFGTVDSWLIWNLTGGAVHQSDATNAARTMLYDIHEGRWSQTMCNMLDIPMSLLPDVRDCAADFGTTDAQIFGVSIPILGVAGDQQAAAVGQACFEPGMIKATYGTGCFALLNTGDNPVASSNKLLTTIAYQLDGRPVYALEGSIFIAGAVVQWLRDGLKFIEQASEIQDQAAAADPSQDVILVPAFTGLGAPYWDAECRGAIFGLTRNSGPKEISRAALECVGFQTRDLLEAMRADGADLARATLRVDGGLAASDWTMQFLADIIDASVDRPRIVESTAIGAPGWPGKRPGIYPGQSEFAANWTLDRRFLPNMGADRRDGKYAAWKRAVAAARSV